MTPVRMELQGKKLRPLWSRTTRHFVLAPMGPDALLIATEHIVPLNLGSARLPWTYLTLLLPLVAHPLLENRRVKSVKALLSNLVVDNIPHTELVSSRVV